jgi:tetratricopeptide (TPR) repeat protein
LRFVTSLISAASICSLFLARAPTALGGTSDLQEARQRWLRGNYEEARALYETLGKDDKSRDAAALGLSRVWQSRGEYDKALAIMESSVRDSPKNAALHARQAELFFLRGRWADADHAIQRALALDADNFLARWVRAELFRARGDLKKAEVEFRWFVRTYTARSDADKDIKNPDELLLVGLAGCENARWNSLSDQFQFILTDVYGDALKYEKEFWPAEHHAGMLLLEKYNRGDALAAFDKALALNPNAAEAWVGKGIAALQKYEIKDAERFAERALKINANLPEALNLQADVYLAVGDVGQATAVLERARRISPREETVLGRSAACLVLQHRDNDFGQLVRDIERYDAKPGVFYLTLAEQLEERRRYAQAERYYKKAAELWPMLAGAHGNLGLLYMRMGREAEARPLLEQAFNADSFNVRVANMLKVLRHLQRYDTVKTPHFEIRFDPVTDRQLARYMSRYLEEIYADLSAKFQYRPEHAVLIEIFNNHEMFSGRTIALPDLHTIGACTGRMVAMASPHAKGVRKPFNWARVLRHELVHVFNLEQTEFQVPHWFTEGLAVRNEGFPRPHEWNQILVERAAAGETLDLDSIDLGFIRPRSPTEWTLAYCQSQLYVDFLEKTYGARSLGQFLEAFRQGLDTAAVIGKVCNMDKDTFERGYRAYLDEVIKNAGGRPGAKPRSLLQLQEAHEKDPQDADISAQLAEQYLIRRRNTEARKLAEGVLAKAKSHALASYVKARLLQSAGDDDQARAVLEAAISAGASEPKVFLALGRLYFEVKDFAKAAEMFELGRKVEPYENKWLVELARTYTQAGDTERRIRALKDLAVLDGDDFESRMQVARLLLDNGRAADAERYARQALEIDAADGQAHRLRGDALLAQKKLPDAIEAYEVALEIDDKLDDARIKLAEAFLQSGDKSRAQAEISKVLTRDPDNGDARQLKQRLGP